MTAGIILFVIILLEIFIAEILALGILFFIKKKKSGKAFKLTWEKLIIISIYAVVIGFISYVALSNYLPGAVEVVNSGEYVIDGSGFNIDRSLKSFYFKDDILGDGVNISGEIYYPVVSEARNNILFRPKKILGEERDAVLEISGWNNGTELYVDDVLVMPDLSNYTKLKEFDDSEVWVRNDYEFDEDDLEVGDGDVEGVEVDVYSGARILERKL